MITHLLSFFLSLVSLRIFTLYLHLAYIACVFILPSLKFIFHETHTVQQWVELIVLYKDIAPITFSAVNTEERVMDHSRPFSGRVKLYYLFPNSFAHPEN